ncbi:hypothetical protein MKX01_016084 [Papaver californicum]|nr:hypothetical protein MKX01_016084 [Papaver californicum]
MRTLCDVCESAAAILFCAADEAALCASCDDKVHLCNKLANRHVRVALADPSDVSRCDICEIAPAFFYCEIDGSSLCLQCDMKVHVGGKRTHERYLLFRQRVKFPGDKLEKCEDNLNPGGNTAEPNQQPNTVKGENLQNHRISPVPAMNSKNNRNGKMTANLVALNARLNRMHGRHSHDHVEYSFQLIIKFRRDWHWLKYYVLQFEN